MGSFPESVMYSILKKKLPKSGQSNLVKSLRRLKRGDSQQHRILYEAIALLYLEGSCLADIDYLKTDHGVQSRWKDVKSCASYWGVSTRVLQKKVKDLKDNSTVGAMLQQSYASERSRSKALCSFSIIITEQPSDSLLGPLLSALENRVDPRPVTWKLVFETRAKLVKGADQMMTPEQKAVFKRVFRQFLSRKGLAGLRGIECTRQTVKIKQTVNGPKKGKRAVDKVTVHKKRVVKLSVYSAAGPSSSSSSSGRVKTTRVRVNPDIVTWPKPPSLAPEVYVPVLVKEDAWKPTAVGNNTSCELFCGTAGISRRLFKQHGFSTMLVDKEDCLKDCRNTSFLKKNFFLQKDVLKLPVRRLKKLFSSRVIWLAPPCFTYSIQSQWIHQRNETNGYYGVTKEAHYINDVVYFLLSWLKRLHLDDEQLVVFEAPEGVFEHTPFATELEELGLKRVRVSQCAWGCKLRKNTLLYTNSKELQKLESTKYCGRGNQGCTLRKEGPLRKHEEQGRGKALKQHGAHYHPAAAKAWADKLAKEVRGILKRKGKINKNKKRRRIN